MISSLGYIEVYVKWKIPDALGRGIEYKSAQYLCEYISDVDLPVVIESRDGIIG